MVDAPSDRPSSRTRRRAIAGVALVGACVGCCTLPFVAGLTIFGVALCSARFVGVVIAAIAGGAAMIALVGYRKRKQRAPEWVPVALGRRSPSDPGA